MAHACGCQSGSAGVLDVRQMAPKLRHPKIFETFDALEPGASFVLVNDHDPKPLLYQFTFERAGAFHWRYLEDGPDVWRVEIGKALPAIRAEQTVGDVAHHHPGTLEAMKALGINHCCGAQLTLTEAAASAGVPLETLLKALNDTGSADA